MRPEEGEALDEFEIIARFFAPLAADGPGRTAYGLRDDAALLQPPSGQALVVSTDTIVETVHFLPEDPPESIGWKALAVNLSDLAAKAATPFAYLLDLSLPVDRRSPSRAPAWLEAFTDGLKALQQMSGIGLVGGDTTATPGPLTISITALGLAPEGSTLPRSGAQAGDRLYLTGTIGDAFLGLQLLRQPGRAQSWQLDQEDVAFLIERYRRPMPRNALTPALRAYARATIDISDGFAADLEKLCRASKTGTSIDAADIPLSPAAQKALRAEPSLLASLLSGGDDYEILAAIPPEHGHAFAATAAESAVSVTPLATLDDRRSRISLCDADGRELAFHNKGYTHFPPTE